MYRPVFGIGLNLPEWVTVNEDCPDVDLANIYICPLCTAMLIHRGVYRLEATGIKVRKFVMFS